MTIDTIAARNKRIRELEAERDEWRELALANEGRAQAAEAKLAELERIHSEVMLQGEAAGERSIREAIDAAREGESDG